MHTLSDDELRRQPQVVLDDAKRGESALRQQHRLSETAKIQPGYVSHQF